MRHVLARDDDRAGRDRPRTERRVARRAPADHPSGRVQPHRLRDDVAREGERRHIVCRRKPVAQHASDLGTELVLNRRMFGEQQPCPRECVCGRLVAGEKNRHRLVADLLVAHRAAVVVARREQHREQVVAGRRGRATRLDHAIDDRVEPRSRIREAPGRGMERDRVEQFAVDRHRLGKRAHRLRERGAHFVHIACNVAREERFGRDRQREMDHRRVDGNRLAVFPGGLLRARRRDHRRCVLRDPVAVERRLHHAPLPQMERPLAAQQPVAEQPPYPRDPATLHVIAAARYERFFDQPGIVQKEESTAAEPPGGDRTVDRQRAEERDEVPEPVRAAGVQQELEGHERTGAGRERDAGGHALSFSPARGLPASHFRRPASKGDGDNSAYTG